jgi:uncharacterized tellurite resistance protein B-like protein
MKFTDLLSVFKSGSATVRSHMKNLIEMAAVDGHFHESEKVLLKSIAKRNGISESQLEQIQNNPTSILLEIPKDSSEKFHQLYDLVHMMSIDNEVHAEEQNLCTLFAIKFGYRREATSELIEAIRLNIKNGISHDEAIKRVKFLL